MITKEDLFSAMVSATNGLTDEPLFTEAEAKKLVDGMDDKYLKNINSTYKDAEEWLDYYTM